MASPIHIVMAARMDRDNRHTCPFPGCRKNLPGSVPACKKHRKAWLAAAALKITNSEEGA